MKNFHPDIMNNRAINPKSPAQYISCPRITKHDQQKKRLWARGQGDAKAHYLPVEWERCEYWGQCKLAGCRGSSQQIPFLLAAIGIHWPQGSQNSHSLDLPDGGHPIVPWDPQRQGFGGSSH
jgi:hypothetical protein